MHSDEFRALARHDDYPKAFVRNRKLPLPTLLTAMLRGMSKSVQAELDEFFGHLNEGAQLVGHVSEQAFAQARAKLSQEAIPALNDYFIEQIERSGGIPRWCGLRLVAVDGSNTRFALRASHMPRAATAEKIAFGLYLPGAEMMLCASLYSIYQGERQMFFDHLDRLCEDDLLLLDRGYPCRWLVGLLNQRGIAFCMRGEVAGNSGFKCVREFLRSGRSEQVVTLPAADRIDVTDYGCPSAPQTVRLVRDVTPSGRVRVLMTNLMDAVAFPASAFGELYHQRWRIEEAFKRLKHRLNLEHVTGLSELAVRQDFAAKVLCDNLNAAATLAAREVHPIPEGRRINRAYTYTALKPLLPLLLLGLTSAEKLLQVLHLIATRTFKHQDGLSKPRQKRHKPHKYLSQKAC